MANDTNIEKGNPMTNEFAAKTFRGWPFLALGLIAFFPIVAAFVYGAKMTEGIPRPWWGYYALSIAMMFLFVFNIIMLTGLTIIQPNTARVVIFFGSYQGTVKTSGFWWINPFAKKPSISLRTNNMVTPTIKVNDIRGNPIEIGAVVVWRVENAARASFDVENFSSFRGHAVRIRAAASGVGVPV